MQELLREISAEAIKLVNDKEDRMRFIWIARGLRYLIDDEDMDMEFEIAEAYVKKHIKGDNK